MATPDERPRAIGPIFNVSSDGGRYHIVVCREGLLALRAPFWGALNMAAHYSRGQSNATVRDPWRLALPEGRRISKLLELPIREIVDQDPKNEFIAGSDVSKVVIARGSFRPWFALQMKALCFQRRYKWASNLNDLQYVREILQLAFGELLATD